MALYHVAHFGPSDCHAGSLPARDTRRESRGRKREKIGLEEGWRPDGAEKVHVVEETEVAVVRLLSPEEGLVLWQQQRARGEQRADGGLTGQRRGRLPGRSFVKPSSVCITSGSFASTFSAASSAVNLRQRRGARQHPTSQDIALASLRRMLPVRERVDNADGVSVGGVEEPRCFLRFRFILAEPRPASAPDTACGA
eukprot:2227542-Rhodomonas_salina.4